MNKKLTLKQFFRDASTGHMALELVERWGKPVPKEICRVTEVHSRSIILRKKIGDSILDLNYASLVDYDGQNLLVYAVGEHGNRTRGPLMLKYIVHRV